MTRERRGKKIKLQYYELLRISHFRSITMNSNNYKRWWRMGASFSNLDNYKRGASRMESYRAQK